MAPVTGTPFRHKNEEILSHDPLDYKGGRMIFHILLPWRNPSSGAKKLPTFLPDSGKNQNIDNNDN
jgi:hypothetical protein